MKQVNKLYNFKGKREITQTSNSLFKDFIKEESIVLELSKSL